MGSDGGKLEAVADGTLDISVVIDCEPIRSALARLAENLAVMLGSSVQHSELLAATIRAVRAVPENPPASTYRYGADHQAFDLDPGRCWRCDAVPGAEELDGACWRCWYTLTGSAGATKGTGRA